MSDLDTVARRHAEIVRSSMVDVEAPPIASLSAARPAGSGRGVRAVVVGAAVVVVVLLPFVFRNGATGPEPTTAIPPQTTPSTTQVPTDGSTFVPPSISDGDSAVFGLVLLDGTRLAVTLPDSLAGEVKGVTPGGAVGWDFGVCCGRTLEVIYGSIADLYGNRQPDAVYEDSGGDPVNFYVANDGPDYFVFQFGSWVVRAWDDGPAPGERFSEEDRRRFASLLDGHETSEGFLVLDPMPPMSVMPADAPDAALTTAAGDLVVAIITSRICPDQAASVTSQDYTVTVSEEAGFTEVCSPAESIMLFVNRTGLSGAALDQIEVSRLATPAEGVISFDPGPLSPRFGHSMAWTGTEMIVWGGNGPNDVADTFDDGAAYNPTTGAWRMISPPPLAGMTGHFAAWNGDETIIVGWTGSAAYNPSTDSWRPVDQSPIPITAQTEFAWSGSLLFIWNPTSDELASLDPQENSWVTIEGPGLNVYPAKLLAKGDRLLAFGTRWPGGPAEPATNDLLSAELVDGQWVKIPTIDFVTSGYANVADPGTATFDGDAVILWGDPSPDPAPARVLHPDHLWGSVPPPPIDSNMLHPKPIPLSDGRILALSEGGNAAIWEPSRADWTPVEILPAISGREVIWTGQQIIAWTGATSWFWTPPPTP